MAIEIGNRTKILLGVVLLLGGAAAAWFFLFQEDTAPPKTVVATSAAKADAAKPAEAPKADAGKPAEAPKAASAEPAKATDAAKAPEAAKGEPAKAEPAKAEPAKAEAAPKPAVQAAAKPIPTNPDQLIAEVIESSGLKSQFQGFGAEVARGAAGASQNTAMRPDDVRALNEAMQRAFEPGKMTEELAAKLKTGLDVERMSRFLEILRQPVARKLTSQELRKVDPEDYKAFNEKIRKEPLPAARVKLMQSVDSVTRSSEVGSELAGAMAREMFDSILAELKKAGKNVPAEARKAAASQLNAVRSQARSQIVALMYYMYRDISDEDLAAYVKLLDTDTGRWGLEQLMNAVRPVLTSRFGSFGRDIAKVALANRMGAVAKAPASAEPEAPPKAATEAASDKPAPAPAEPVGYQRPANLRDLYARYNDLVTATVMRDNAAVKELLDDGKSPNARQSDGSTPLMIAAGNNDAEIANMLLAKGADPNLRAAGGATALSVARARGQAGAGMVQLLQRAGARD